MNKKELTALGFDFGLKRIGVAVGQSITKTATPLITLQAKNGTPNWQELAALITKWSPNILVVGIPIAITDEKLSVTEAAKQFVTELKKRFNLPVEEVDERYTTKEARAEIFATGGYKALQETEIDSVAAKLIVEQWLSTQ